MRAEIRRRVEMFDRVLDFITANPFDDASHAPIVTRLQQNVVRAQTLSLQQQDGTQSEHASITRRNNLRAIMQRELHHLHRVALLAAADNPALGELMPTPVTHVAQQNFINTARVMLAAAKANQDTLVALGLGTSFVDQLTQQVTAFDAEVEVSNLGRRNHVGASADLQAVTEECLELCRILDGVNQERFQTNAELMAAWTSARRISDPARKPAAGGQQAAA